MNVCSLKVWQKNDKKNSILMYVRPEVSDSSVIEYDIKTSSRSCLRFSLVEPSFDVVSIRNRYLICDMKLQGKKCQNILL